jgi:hypothetical protein
VGDGVAFHLLCPIGLTVPHQREEEAPTGIEPVCEALQASA